MSKIPVIINNKNLLDWPSRMAEIISTFDNVGEIIFLDNGSTYKPLLYWYDTCPYKVIYEANLGNVAPWIIALPEELESEYYVVTDPDLDLEGLPSDTLTVLKEKLDTHPQYDYIGLGLRNYNVPLDSPYHHMLQSWAERYWNPNSIIDGLLTEQIVDTTFAMYKKGRYYRGKSCATAPPYTARHIPWEITTTELRNLKQVNYEYYYYLKNATAISSYKAFVGFDTLNFEE